MAELATGEVPFEPEARPKLGLALSGGGFRTALFHIGVLLRLAELGILGAVEVISTVSGGSIVGAAYYLGLLARLREGGGAPLSNREMVGIVAELASTFPEGVKRNVRVRAFSSYFRNVQMCRADYSRSDRVAELYDQLFLRGAFGTSVTTRMRDLEEMVAIPDGAPAKGCRPRLFINSTSLTTGRDWRFSARTMGEPELQGQAADIDRVMRFASPPSYRDLPAHTADIPVSIAVAASSALPGGLHPMSISGMYERIRIQLTDGGVHDNQGVETLLGAGCTHFVVSDTGGQMASEENARTSFLSVLLRAPQILYGRVRQEQLLRASAALGRRVRHLHSRNLLRPRVLRQQAGADPGHRRGLGHLPGRPDVHLPPALQRPLPRPVAARDRGHETAHEVEPDPDRTDEHADAGGAG